MPGTIGLISLGLFFWGHGIVQLAGWEELLLIAVRVLLLVLETDTVADRGYTRGRQPDRVR